MIAGGQVDVLGAVGEDRRAGDWLPSPSVRPRKAFIESMTALTLAAPSVVVMAACLAAVIPAVLALPAARLGVVQLVSGPHASLETGGEVAGRCAVTREEGSQVEGGGTAGGDAR